MMPAERLRVAIVGAGNIAGPYADELAADETIDLLGVTDLEADRAEALANRLGIRAYPSLDALLADEAVEAAVTLTPHRSHAAISMQALRHGKHAYSEKPLAIEPDEARALVREAEQRGLRLACAPSAFMGEAPQTAWKCLREGAIGTVRVVYAEVNWGRIESWHPAPESFYDIGVMIDVGIYPLSLLACILGPVRRVQAYGRVVHPNRTTREGRHFQVRTPDFVVASVEYASGPVLRLTTNWYVEQGNSPQHGIEFHGDEGSLVTDWLRGDAPVQIAPVGEKFSEVPLVRQPVKGIIWSRALPDLARAIAEGRPHRASGDLAAHLVDVMSAIATSIASGGPVDVTSTFPPPAPMEWAR